MYSNVFVVICRLIVVIQKVGISEVGKMTFKKSCNLADYSRFVW